MAVPLKRGEWLGYVQLGLAVVGHLCLVSFR